MSAKTKQKGGIIDKIQALRQKSLIFVIIVIITINDYMYQ